MKRTRRKAPAPPSVETPNAESQSFDESEVEYPTELEATRIRFWPAREAIDRDFVNTPELILALRALGVRRQNIWR